MLQSDFQGNVRKLDGEEGKYRLRVGDFGILLVLENDLIFVHGVKNRKDAHRR
jgi:mRNA-degrading endonuclease RelE of RelBE toxin-antitoxin system